MPDPRIFTVRGQVPAAEKHTKIQLSMFEPTHQYQIIEFKITSAALNVVATPNAILTMGRADATDPNSPDYADQNQLAWANYYTWRTGTALPGSETLVTSYNGQIDDKLFAYDLWLHSEDKEDNANINWFIKVLRYETTEVMGSITSLRQHLYGT